MAEPFRLSPAYGEENLPDYMCVINLLDQPPERTLRRNFHDAIRQRTLLARCAVIETASACVIEPSRKRTASETACAFSESIEFRECLGRRGRPPVRFTRKTSRAVTVPENRRGFRKDLGPPKPRPRYRSASADGDTRRWDAGRRHKEIRHEWLAGFHAVGGEVLHTFRE